MLRREYLLPDLEATRALAAQIAPCLRPGFCLALRGNLGAGKTEFARALLRARGVAGDVPSPTFTLVQNYETPGLRIAHFDLYRLKSADELDELGWDDAMAEGAVIVEWPDRAGNRLPSGAWVIDFETGSDGARVCRLFSEGDERQ